MKLGRLEKLDLRTYWKKEATDFTPWLAQEENIQLLSETIGIELEDLPDVENCEPEDRASIIAFYKLTIIARALNEGWTPNWQDPNQYKYYPWFKVANPTRFVYADTYSTATSAIADIGSRLCCKSEELAIYFGKQFEKLWAEYLLF